MHTWYRCPPSPSSSLFQVMFKFSIRKWDGNRETQCWAKPGLQCTHLALCDLDYAMPASLSLCTWLFTVEGNMLNRKPALKGRKDWAKPLLLGSIKPGCEEGPLLPSLTGLPQIWMWDQLTGHFYSNTPHCFQLLLALLELGTNPLAQNEIDVFFLEPDSWGSKPSLATC